MGEREVRALLAAGAIEPVQADPTTAGEELAAAQRHVATAEQIAESDPSAAFAVGYDAMRKAISAHLRAKGWRVKRGPAHHSRTGPTRWLPSTTSGSPSTSMRSTTSGACATSPSTTP